MRRNVPITFRAGATGAADREVLSRWGATVVGARRTTGAGLVVLSDTTVTWTACVGRLQIVSRETAAAFIGSIGWPTWGPVTF